MTITKTRKLSLKQERFIEQYITNGGNATQAVMDAGYKCKDNIVAKAVGAENLAKPNIAGSLALRKAEIRGKTEDLREKCVRKLENIIESLETKPATAIKAIDILGKMSGWHSATTVLETGSRQRELSEAERQEAQRLAILRFNPQYALPAQFEQKVEPVQCQGASVGDNGDTESNEVNDVQGQEQAEGSGEGADETAQGATEGATF